MAATAIAQLNAQMKTDAYTECRGVGRIGINDRAVGHPGQAMNFGAAVEVQKDLEC